MGIQEVYKSQQKNEPGDTGYFQVMGLKMENNQYIFEFIKSEKRVCPKPDLWNEIWEMLPNKEQVVSGWSPPLPLILSAWWQTSDQEKKDRLKTHLIYAEQNGVLEEVSVFLKNIDQDQWIYEGDV